MNAWLGVGEGLIATAIAVIRRSQEFYSAYFGFDPATAQQYADGTVIIRNADGFDLE